MEQDIQDDQDFDYEYSLEKILNILPILFQKTTKSLHLSVVG